MMYQGQFSPFLERRYNNMELFNESLTLVSSYHLMAFTDWVPDIENRYVMGWSLVFIVMICFIVNFSSIFEGIFK
jgi:hypothetical protein